MYRNSRKILKDIYFVCHAKHSYAHFGKEWYTGLPHLGGSDGLTRSGCIQFGQKRRGYKVVAKRGE